jgi:hypothetical protein
VAIRALITNWTPSTKVVVGTRGRIFCSLELMVALKVREETYVLTEAALSGAWRQNLLQTAKELAYNALLQHLKPWMPIAGGTLMVINGSRQNSRRRCWV